MSDNVVWPSLILKLFFVLINVQWLHLEKPQLQSTLSSVKTTSNFIYRWFRISQSFPTGYFRIDMKSTTSTILTSMSEKTRTSNHYTDVNVKVAHWLSIHVILIPWVEVLSRIELAFDDTTKASWLMYFTAHRIWILDICAWIHYLDNKSEAIDCSLFTRKFLSFLTKIRK